ncbi:uncharacterized protein BDZ99DRAFT_469094, partial [Mytilinidion resinicola]
MSGEPADSSSVPPFKGPPAPPLPHLIAHRSSQTGDTLHIAAALALYDFVDVIVVHVGAIGTTEGLLNFYRQATDPTYPGAAISPNSPATNKRVKVVYASNEAAAEALYTTLSWIKASDTTVQDYFPKILAAGDLSSETSKVGTTPAVLKQIKPFDEFKANYLKNKIGGVYQYMGNLGQATSAIAEKFKNPQTSENQKALYTLLAKKLTARDLASADIIKGTLQEPKFGQQFLPDADPNKQPFTPVVLLWARYTGTNTAIAHNPEGDSCVQGQRQINDVLISLGLNVVTIGHGPRGSQPFKGHFDVGEFYKEADTPIKSDRATQQSFFLALMEKYPGRVYQIGQKTGGMDGAALLGIPTIYLEHNGSAAIKRMAKWTNGQLPFYRNVITEQPAPAVVRAQKAFIPDTQPLYNGWKTSTEQLQRAKARLAAMFFAFPKEMGRDDFVLEPSPENPPPSVKPDKKDAWRLNQVKVANNLRFAKIVDFIKTLEDTDVQEDRINPALDGEWTKKVHSVNQDPNLPHGAAGYSDGDLVKIKKAMEELVHDY